MSLPSSPSLLAFASVLGRSGREDQFLSPPPTSPVFACSP